MSIPIYKPYLPKSSLQYAHDALDSTWISSQGKYIRMVEEKLKDLLGVKYVLPVNNGTSACHLVAKALKRKYNLDEIIVPNNVYVAALNAFLFDNDWKLYSVECDINTWNYDLNALDAAIMAHPKAAVLLVHNMGGIINKPELQRKYPNTVFVEDACEAFLGKYENQYAGTASFANAFSTFANKTVCSGEGGFAIFDDESTYNLMKCVHAQGQSSERFIHNELGYNFRITNIQSAILMGQLEIVDQILEMKNDIFNIYRNIFKDREDVLLQEQVINTVSANWMFGIRLPKQQDYSTAEIYFKEKGIEIRPMFYYVGEHLHILNNQKNTLDGGAVAKQLNNQCIVLPSYPELTIDEQMYIVDTVEEYIKELK